jgi:hypothetical protein
MNPLLFLAMVCVALAIWFVKKLESSQILYCKLVWFRHSITSKGNA